MIGRTKNQEPRTKNQELRTRKENAVDVIYENYYF